MPWEPRFPNYAGILPILQNAKAIITRDIADALAWAYGTNTPGEAFKRIQFTQHHSDVYPLLTIEPANTDFNEIDGGVELIHTFACSIYLVREKSARESWDAVDMLPQDVIRYLDATMMCFISASSSDWRVNLTSDQGKVTISIGEITLGPLQQGQKESDGKYFHSALFGLEVSLTESQ